VPDDAPPRPGVSLYGHSKYLGREIVRLFAEYDALETPTLCAAPWRSPSLPAPFRCMHIVADLPLGKYSGATAQRVLHWRPRDDLAHLWARRSEEEA
jgi:hypothetical protein